MHLLFFRLRSLFLFFRYKPGVDYTSFVKNSNMLIFRPFSFPLFWFFVFANLDINVLEMD